MQRPLRPIDLWFWHCHHNEAMNDVCRHGGCDVPVDRLWDAVSGPLDDFMVHHSAGGDFGAPIVTPTAIARTGASSEAQFEGMVLKCTAIEAMSFAVTLQTHPPGMRAVRRPDADILNGGFSWRVILRCRAFWAVRS